MCESSNELERFLQWLGSQGIYLARFGMRRDVKIHCPACMSSPTMPRVQGCAGVDTARLSARDRQLLQIVGPESAALSARLLEEIPCPRCEGRVWIYQEKVRDDLLTFVEESYPELVARYERNPSADAYATREADRNADVDGAVR